VLTTNSIPHWDTTNHRDVLTLTFSVDDSTVQAIRLEGIANYIQNLPNVQTLLKTGDLPQPPTDARGRSMRSQATMHAPAPEKRRGSSR
jgi:hypothetical protein